MRKKRSQNEFGQDLTSLDLTFLQSIVLLLVVRRVCKRLRKEEGNVASIESWISNVTTKKFSGKKKERKEIQPTTAHQVCGRKGTQDPLKMEKKRKHSRSG